MEKDAEAEYPPLRMTAAQVDRLEAEIDVMNERLEPLRSFILPGGSPLAAKAVKYLNRLSDWFFVASRIANDDGKSDVLWVPGANR